MKTYEAIYSEEVNEGVYALSVVENPAMEDMFIAMAEHPKQIDIQMADEKKRLLLGAALIPNKKIYRNIDGQEFYITFSEDTIEKLAHNFFKNQNNNNSSLEHEVALSGMSVVEGWIVQDTLKDKSANFGKQYPKGTFVTMMKVENEEVWKKVLNGEIKGFSIDAMLGLKEVQLKSNKMEQDELKKGIVSELTDVIKALFSKSEEDKKESVIELKQEDNSKKEEIDFDKKLEEFKASLSADYDKKIEELKLSLTEKDTKIKELETQLSNTLEQEEVIETPAAQKQPVKFAYGQNRPLSIQDRVFEVFNS